MAYVQTSTFTFASASISDAQIEKKMVTQTRPGSDHFDPSNRSDHV